MVPELTLDDIRATAREIALHGLFPDYHAVQDWLERRRPYGETPRWAVWECLRGYITDHESLALVDWKINSLKSHIRIAGGNEESNLRAVFRRLVVDHIPRPTEKEVRQFRNGLFTREARAWHEKQEQKQFTNDLKGAANERTSV